MSNDQVGERLAQSLESTSRGLSAFLHSAEAFRNALKPYQQMQIVLMQQRLWAKQHKREDLDPLWAQIAASSRELHRVFSGFAGVMDVLRSIESLDEPADLAGKPAEPGVVAAERTPPGIDDGLPGWLERALSGFKLGPSRLTALGSREKSAAHVERLVQAGVLEPCGRGSYRLTESAARRVARDLAE